jgi:hypothetical protein
LKKQWIVGLLALAAIAALVFLGRDRVHFDFGVFRSQLAQADPVKIAVSIACVYLADVFRAVRWALLLRHIKKVGPFSLIGTQVMGFTAIALVGRVADPVRPYLVARKTGLPITSQIAVYIVERLFDAGAMALIFCTVILLAPSGAMPHGEMVKRSAYWGLIFTVLGSVFVVAVRVAGATVASFMEHSLGGFSKKLAHAIGHKIRAFHAGLDIMRSFSDFAATAAVSLLMWVVILTAYLEIMRAFAASPRLAAATIPDCLVTMVASGAAGATQLPIIGWFTQTAIVAALLTKFFGVAPEAATACAATMLIVTFLSIAPVGLIWAQVENVSLRKVTAETEHAIEVLTEEDTESAG